MKILVSGSRNYKDSLKLIKVLAALNPIEVVHGAAIGADSIAESWCRRKGIVYHGYPADWGTYGNAAGSIRNQAMLDAHPDIDLVLAFPLKGSIGTWHMVKISEAQGFPVRVISE